MELRIIAKLLGRTSETGGNRLVAFSSRVLLRGQSRLLFCALAAAACGTDAPSSGLDAPVRELVLERTLTSPSSLELSGVTQLHIDSRGRIFAVDGYQGGVTVLSSTLELLRVVGRDGEGPGEFKSRRIQVLGDDSLAVYDRQLARMTLFDPDTFGVVRTHGTSEYGNDAPGYYWLMGASQSLARWVTSYSPSDESDAGRTDLIMTAALDGASPDTVLTVPSSESLVYRSSFGMMVGFSPFGATPLIRPLDQSSFIYANTGEAGFWIVGLSGDTIAAGEIPATSIPVTPSQLESAVARMGDELGGVLSDGAPYQWPIIVALVSEDAEDPRIWISVRGADGAADWPVHIYDSRGQRTAASSLPAGEILHSVRDGIAMTTSTDDLGIPRIHMYRIAPSPGL